MKNYGNAIRLSIIVNLLFLTGCVTTNKFEVATFEKPGLEQFPETAVFLKLPSDNLKQECVDFEQSPGFKYCQINPVPLADIQTELQATNLFNDIRLADEESEYQLLFNITTLNTQTGGDIFYAGPTPVVTAVEVNATIRVEVLLQWSGETISEHEYNLPIKHRPSPFNNQKKFKSDIAKSVVSHAVSDLQKKQAFSTDYLYSSLQASDYKQDLTLPEALADFTFDQSYIIPNPFYGSQHRFTHRQFQFDYLDIFVYPIRDWQWQNQEEYLVREAANVRKEIAYYSEKESSETLTLNNHTISELGGENAKTKILYFDGDLESEINGNYHTETYLFLQKDKLIKVRANFAKTSDVPLYNTTPIIEELVDSIRVPNESKFMSSVRDDWKKRTELEQALEDASVN